MRILIAIAAFLLASAGGYWGYKTFLEGGAGKQAHGLSKQSDQMAALKALGETAPTTPVADRAVFEALAAAVSDLVTVTYGGFEPDGAGVLAKDVVVALTAKKEIGVRIETVQLWGAEASAFSALKEGAPDAGVRIADRLDLQGVRFFGFDKLTEEFMDGYVDAIEDLAPEEISDELEAELSEALDMTIESYEYRFERSFIDGLTLYPLPTLATFKSDVNEQPLMAYFQDWAKLARAVSFEASASYGMSLNMNYEMQGQKTSMVMSAPFYATKGLRRGDIDFTAASDLLFAMDFSIPASEMVDENGAALLDPGAPPFEMAFNMAVDLYAIEGMKFAKLFEFLARGEVPPTTQTDLMSLGTWRVLGEEYGFGDEAFYRVDETVIDLADFHWFAPTKFRAKSTGIKYDIEGVLQWVNSLTAIAPDADAVQTQEMIQNVAALLKEQGFSKLNFDMDYGFNWDPQTGAGDADYYLDFKDFSRLSIESAGSISNFEKLASLIPAEGEAFDVAALETVSNEATFSDFSFVITDDGGIDRSFGLAVAFADLAPEGDQSMQFLKGANIGDLKVSSAAMIRISSGQAAQAFPPAGPYLQSLADFIQKGGALRVSAKPAAPVKFVDIQGATAEDPTKIVGLLGLTVERTGSKEINRED